MIPLARADATSDASIPKRWLITLFVLIALGVRLSFIFAEQPWNPSVLETRVLQQDAYWYDAQAVTIAESGSFAQFDDDTHVYIKCPGYQVFVAIFYAIFGHSIWVVLLVQALIGAAILFIVYEMARQLTPLRSAKYIAAFLYSICFLSAYFSSKLLTETLFTLLFTYAVLLLIRAFTNCRAKHYILAGLLLGIATLVRPVSQYYPIVIGVTLLFQKERLVVRVRNLGLLLLVFLVVISTWQMRNYSKYGYYSLTNHGIDVWRMQAAVLKSSIEHIPLKQAQDELIGNALVEVNNPFKRADISKKIGLDYIKLHIPQMTTRFCSSTLRRTLGTGSEGIYSSFFSGKDAAESQDAPMGVAQKIHGYMHGERGMIILRVFMGLIILVELFFSTVAIVIMIAKRQLMLAFFLACTLFYFLAIPGLMATVRFKVPVLPILIVLSAIGMSNFIQLLRSRQDAHFPR